MKEIEYLQTKIDYLKDTRYLHEDVSDTVCEALDLAIEYLEKKIEELQEPTEREYQSEMAEIINANRDLEDSQR